jgi:iron(III) transport system ATP-binding protein
LLSAAQAIYFGIDSNSEDVILRPEDFRVSNTVTSEIKGTIRKISFWGSFYEADVEADNLKIVVRLNTNEFRAGEEVWISVKK